MSSEEESDWKDLKIASLLSEVNALREAVQPMKISLPRKGKGGFLPTVATSSSSHVPVAFSALMEIYKTAPPPPLTIQRGTLNRLSNPLKTITRSAVAPIIRPAGYQKIPGIKQSSGGVGREGRKASKSSLKRPMKSTFLTESVVPLSRRRHTETMKQRPLKAFEGNRRSVLSTFKQKALPLKAVQKKRVSHANGARGSLVQPLPFVVPPQFSSSSSFQHNNTSMSRIQSRVNPGLNYNGHQPHRKTPKKAVTAEDMPIVTAPAPSHSKKIASKLTPSPSSSSSFSSLSKRDNLPALLKKPLPVSSPTTARSSSFTKITALKSSQDLPASKPQHGPPQPPSASLSSLSDISHVLRRAERVAAKVNDDDDQLAAQLASHSKRLGHQFAAAKAFSSQYRQLAGERVVELGTLGVKEEMPESEEAEIDQKPAVEEGNGLPSASEISKAEIGGAVQGKLDKYSLDVANSSRIKGLLHLSTASKAEEVLLQ